MTPATYTIADPWQLGEVIATVTDPLTQRTRAVYLDSLGKPRDIVIGEPLCCGCDLPVSDGKCDCAFDAAALGRVAA